MRLGIATDHGGFSLKKRLFEALHKAGHHVVDFGAKNPTPEDDYPDYVIPLARAVARGEIERGIAICGSGVGACIVANKIPKVRAGLIHDVYSARQGVEEDDMNILCLGGRVIGYELAWEVVQAFLVARFQNSERYRRRLDKIAALERKASLVTQQE
jgi:ribose 5-phosphate isomerase B